VHESGFRHEMLTYAGGRTGFIGGVLPLVSQALDRGAPVLVAVRRDLIDALRRELGDDARRVRFRDMESLGRNPARIIPVWAGFLAGEGAGRRALGVGEALWPGRSDAESDECDLHEGLLNRAFGDGRGWDLVCPYDADRLGDDVIGRAGRSHAFVRREGLSERSPSFGREASGWPALSGRLPAPRSEPVHEMRFAAGDLAAVRAFVASLADSAGLTRQAVDDLALAVSELATNSILHGGGSGMCRVWSEGSNLLCEVSDSGEIRSPMAGRVKPAPDQVGGRGLWVVNQICELVQLRSGSGGTVVRIHTRRRP